MIGQLEIKMSRRKQSNPKPLKLDEPWTEGGEEQPKEPKPSDNGEDSKESQDEPVKDQEDNQKESVDVEKKVEMGKQRSRGSLPDSSELSETEEPDRLSSRQEGGSSSRSRTPERSSDFGSPGPFSQQQQQFLQAGIPYLHLLPPHIRNDAARLFLMPQMLPPELASVTTAVPTSPSPGTKDKSGPGSTSGSEPSRSGPLFMCEPCNIKFSSARTLEAHQTYYCSFRKDGGRESVQEDAKGDPPTPGPSKRNRDLESGDESESLDSFQLKSQKTGKLYNCIYCSYSADKKVSLNRHMRMHSGSNSGSGLSISSLPKEERPTTPGKSPQPTKVNMPDNVSAMERYCQDCDIQFSSIKTYRVHKQYYCSTRHVLKAQQSAVVAALAAQGSSAPAALGKAPVELGPGVTVTPVKANSISSASPNPETSPISTPVPLSSQPFIVLPTNPVIVVPYCFIQGASFLPGNVLPSHNAIVVMPNGSVQSLPGSGPVPVPSPSPQSIIGSHMMMHSPFPSGTPGPSIMSPSNFDHKEMIKIMNSSGSSKESEHESMISPSKVQKSRGSGRSSRSSEDLHHHERQEGLDESMPAIDLTFRSIQPKKEVCEEEKENQLSSRNSRISRDSRGALEENSRSRSVTPGTSGNGHHQQQSSSGEGNRAISPLEKSGKRTPRPSSASISSTCSTPPASDPKMNGIAQILGKGGEEANKMMMMMLNAGAAAAASAALDKKERRQASSGVNGDKLSPLSTQLPGGAILTSATNQSLADLLMTNPPELNESLAKLNPQLLMNAQRAAAAAAASGFNFNLNPAFMQAINPELAVRLLDPSYLASLQQSLQQSQNNQTGGKRGVSKCVECEIVFYKYENYLVHKEHYCAARAKQYPSQPTTPTASTSTSSKKGNGTRSKDPRQSSCSSPSKSDLDSEECISPPPPPPQRKPSLTRKSPDDSPLVSPAIKVKTSPSISPSPSPKPNGNGLKTNQFGCPTCAVKFTTIDNLATHQAYYCTKKFDNGEAEEKERNGFLRCGKCKLAIPSDQMATHIRVCLGQQSPFNSRGDSPSGWKCPCCDVYSPTVSSAQKHLETHTGIRAFKCLLCGYRGNTLRGMRTHIRTHFDKRVFDLLEGDYMTCITASDVDIPTSSNSPTGSSKKRFSPEVKEETSSQPPTPDDQVISGDVKMFASPQDMLMMTMMTDPDSSENNNQQFPCNLCSYSSPYKQSMIKHMRSVHKVQIGLEESSENGKSQQPSSSESENGKERKCSSQSSAEEDKDKDQNYCKSCDISFNYVSSFNAHKKFYCSQLAQEEEQERAETPVQ